MNDESVNGSSAANGSRAGSSAAVGSSAGAGAGADSSSGARRRRRAGGRRGAGGGDLIVIYWRDIPAQVNAGSGATKVQRILPRRFHRAIDRAAMVAGLTQASQYVGEWRRVPVPGDGGDDPEAAALRAAATFEADYPRERLDTFVKTGGWDPDRTEPPPVGVGWDPDAEQSPPAVGSASDQQADQQADQAHAQAQSPSGEASVESDPDAEQSPAGVDPPHGSAEQEDVT